MVHYAVQMVCDLARRQCDFSGCAAGYIARWMQSTAGWKQLEIGII